MTIIERPQIRYKKPWDRATQDKKKRAALRSKRLPFIYFFRCRMFIKIGWTTDVLPRLSNIQMANPDPVKMAALMCGGASEEAVLHRVFQPLLYRAEWFREEGHLANLIDLIHDLEPSSAREVAGQWFFREFGKVTLFSYDPPAQNPDQGPRTQQESM